MQCLLKKKATLYRKITTAGEWQAELHLTSWEAKERGEVDGAFRNLGRHQERSELCLEEVEPNPCLGSSTSEPTPIALHLVVCSGLPRLIGIETFTPGKGVILAAGSQQAAWPHPIPYPCFKRNSSVFNKSERNHRLAVSTIGSRIPGQC